MPREPKKRLLCAQQPTARSRWTDRLLGLPAAREERRERGRGWRRWLRSRRTAQRARVRLAPADQEAACRHLPLPRHSPGFDLHTRPEDGIGIAHILDPRPLGAERRRLAG